VIGRTTFKNIGTKVAQKRKNIASIFKDKKRRANTGLAVEHYFRKDSGRNLALGATVGSLTSLNTGGRPTVLRTLEGTASGAMLANGVGFVYRAIRTFFRNPLNQETLTQMTRYQRDLDEAGPSLTSKAKKQAVNLKNQAIKLKNKLFKRDSK
jgi:hypothetical protein